MAPPRNTARRNAIADAAIEILGTAGSHRLSHRGVDERSGLPPGTAANYYPTRDDLLAAAADRIAALQFAEMAAATDPRQAAGTAARDAAAGEPDGGFGPDQLAILLGHSLYAAATAHRTRYLAVFELLLESTRQPALAQVLAQLGGAALGATSSGHRSLGLRTSPEQVQALIALYGGTLLTLVTSQPETVTPERTLALARSMVAGVLTSGPARSHPAPPGRP
jgi:DNA-binding transcriptional regulator YbjK